MRKNRNKYINIICERCGEKKPVRSDVLKSQGQRFCSLKCANDHMRENVKTGKDHPSYKQIEASCDYCDKKFKKPPSHLIRCKHNYCSKQCANEHFKKLGTIKGEKHPQWEGNAEYTCLKCEEIVSVKSWRVEYLKFCSAKCASVYNTKHGLNSTQFEKGAVPFNKGKKWEELFDEETIKRLKSEEQRIKLSCGIRGIPVSDFDGFVSNERQLAMKLPEYKRWRTDVFERDNYVCRACGEDQNCCLIAHHMKAYSRFGEERLNVANGITLCKGCHYDFHKQHGVADFTEENFGNWIKTKEKCQVLQAG